MDITENSNTDHINKSVNKADLNESVKIEKHKNMPKNKISKTKSCETLKDNSNKAVYMNKKHFLSNEKASENWAPNDETVKLPVFEYGYSKNQWLSLNKIGKKCYEIKLLMQIKDDPLSKIKPNIPLLKTYDIMRSIPLGNSQSFSHIPRSSENSYPLPKPVISSKGNGGRDAYKDRKHLTPKGKGNIKLLASPSSSANNKSHTIHVSLSSPQEIKLNQVESAWKPKRFRKDYLTEEEYKTQEVYNKFRGILNKLTPEKFDTLLDKLKTLEINNQKRLQGVIDLVFEKAIDEPNFSVAYATMCYKLSMLKVPADNATSPDQVVNFRALLINKCQKQFETKIVDEKLLQIEKQLQECDDAVQKKELQLIFEDENRRVRMRSVGNVRFIGELYKLKMLTNKIMNYCMIYLIDKAEEDKLECLCNLLTTIGKQIESESNTQLDTIFKKMQHIVHRKSHNVSSRIRFMIQDVIDLRKRKWVVKNIVDIQPKMMNQIQKEAEQEQRYIELINANVPASGFRREESGSRGRNNQGDNRRKNSHNSFFTDSSWKIPKTNYSVNTSKLKVVSQKNLNNIKLAPHVSTWNIGLGTKNIAQGVSSSITSLNNNMYSILTATQTDPMSINTNRNETLAYYSKGASIERSTFNSKTNFDENNKRSGSVDIARSKLSITKIEPKLVNEVNKECGGEIPGTSPVADRMPRDNAVKDLINEYLHDHELDEAAYKVKTQFSTNNHVGVVDKIFDAALEKAPKDVALIATLLVHLVSTSVITPANLLTGMKTTFHVAPDLYVDIPMLYEFLGKFIAPHIEKEHITFAQIFELCGVIISSNHGHLLLNSILNEMVESIGPRFVKNKWLESNLQVNDWIGGVDITKLIQENKLNILLEGYVSANQDTNIGLSPTEIQSKLLEFMNSNENCESIRSWIQGKIGIASNEDWFIRSLIQAICEYSLFGPERRSRPYFKQDHMKKYISLVLELGVTKQLRESSCLFGIQQLIHRLQYPQGVTLDIFQYFYEHCIISLEGFLEWELSEKEPQGKGVMMKALTSFFANIKEGEKEDSCTDD